LKAVVTGGAGFIGHHLIYVLSRQGVDVTVLDIAARPPVVQDRPGIEYFQGSILDGAVGAGRSSSDTPRSPNSSVWCRTILPMPRLLAGAQ
jgi:nucleoside-diphosphate-sugar epimerase